MKNAIILLLLLIISYSCTDKIVFTQDLRNSIEVKRLDLNKVQFYNSDEIVLRRELSRDSAMLAMGELKFEKGQIIDEVVIKRETPGTCEKYDKKSISIAFEEGEGKLIRFVKEEKSNTYVLYMVPDAQNYGTLDFDSLRFYVRKGGANAKLLIKKDEKYIDEYNQTILKGKTVIE